MRTAGAFVTLRRPGPMLVRIHRARTQRCDPHLRRIFGRRFLRRTHKGHTAGLRYRRMLEVVGENLARSPISRLAASSGLRPRLPISAELRLGINSGAASGADRAARRRLPSASLAPTSKRPALALS